jgi:hypothetical protein
MSAKTLRVRTNPFFALDHHGCPCGVAAHEFVKGRNGQLFRPTEFIGARRASNPEVEREAPPGDPEIGRFTKAKVHIRYVFDPGDIEIADTRYNRLQVADGVLLAANAETAKACGIKFVAPDEVRESWRKRQGCEVDPLWKGDAPKATQPDAAPDPEPEPTPKPDTKSSGRKAKP